jgi:sterol desaturase/sphingolipid hydroxylase (fatty acid hydroxylase superfamily)
VPLIAVETTLPRSARVAYRVGSRLGTLAPVIDPTIAAVPGLLGAMGVEHAWLVRHAEERGVVAGRYELRDTATSLSLGLASLAAPAVAARVLRPLTPGRGRWGRALVGASVGAALVTTVADVAVRRADAGPAAEVGGEEGEGPRGAGPGAGRAPSHWSDVARRVSGSAGTVAVAGAIVAAATTWASRTGSRRLWQRWGHRHDLGTGVVAVGGAVMAWDLLYYWNHRLMHSSRWLWAIHSVHHSSERYNLSTAVRQPVAESLGAFLPFGLLSVAGFRPELVQLARSVNLLHQFWIHTEAIGQLGALEAVLNTPSHHRVHHGSNRRYLDRNHGSILIVWDRLFGTFQAEDEPPDYGLTEPLGPASPVRVAVREPVAVLRQAAGSRTWRSRIAAVVCRPRSGPAPLS